MHSKLVTPPPPKPNVQLTMSLEEAQKLRQIMGSNSGEVSKAIFAAYKTNHYFENQYELTRFMSEVYHTLEPADNVHS